MTLNRFYFIASYFILISYLSFASELGTPELSDIIYPNGKESIYQVRLGNALFFDKRLSGNKTMSCGSCHKPDHGFAENKKIAVGSTNIKLKRHTPHLVNLGWQKDFFWDGRSASLEDQVLRPIKDIDGMNLPLDQLILRLKKDKAYVLAFQRSYPGEGITTQNVAKSLSAFGRTLVSRNSKFDRYLAGDQNAMSEDAIKGMYLFEGKAKCITCHKGDNFTDNEFHNTGVVVPDSEKGRLAIDRIGGKEFDIVPYPFFASKAAFKTPSLRNVGITPPYFHNGSEPGLIEVLEFYNQGGKDLDKSGRANGIGPLGLSAEEIDQIIEFLRSLTDKIKIKELNSKDLNV